MSLLAAALTDRIEHAVEAVSGPWLYLLAGALTFAETGTLFFLVPGEVGLLVAGAAAGAGNLSLPVMLVVANLAAILGDAVGFTIGRRFGPNLQRSRLGRKIGHDHWQRAERLIQRRKGVIVLFGRWIGFLRAIMPATAGMSGMSYRSFVPWDLAGCISWASVCVVGGYLLGDNWKTLASQLSKVGWVLLAVLVVAVVVHKLRKRRRGDPDEGDDQTSPGLSQPGPNHRDDTTATPTVG
jgi:membrane protein DedA with SNARE-associated domain